MRRNNSVKERVWPTHRKHNPVGKDAYIEESGERLGVVDDEVLGADNSIIGYEVIENESKSILYFPSEQVETNRRGVIIRPLWYVEAMKIIRRMEIQSSMMPELTGVSKNISTDELQALLSKTNPEIIYLIEAGVSVRDSIRERIDQLNKNAESVRNEILMSAGMYLGKGEKRKELAEKMQVYRRKLHIIESNINRCNELLLRLESSSLLPKKLIPEKTTFAHETMNDMHISCPYIKSCQIIDKIRQGEKWGEEVKPLRVLKMEAMKEKIESEGKRIEEEIRKRLMVDFRLKDVSKKEMEETIRDFKEKKEPEVEEKEKAKKDRPEKDEKEEGAGEEAVNREDSGEQEDKEEGKGAGETENSEDKGIRESGTEPGKEDIAAKKEKQEGESHSGNVSEDDCPCLICGTELENSVCPVCGAEHRKITEEKMEKLRKTEKKSMFKKKFLRFARNGGIVKIGTIILFIGIGGLIISVIILKTGVML
ncbi:MAG: hypothetical protein L6408_00710 [Nanoarchaeota archaeon]|nr:hypothetical protein [Nanoarchaeota archaeon]